jgi:hypothetical protein
MVKSGIDNLNHSGPVLEMKTVDCPHCGRENPANESGYYQCEVCTQEFNVQAPVASVPAAVLNPPKPKPQRIFSKKDQICETCGSVGTPKTHTPGSIYLELFLYFVMILPGLLYSAWRLSARKKVCRQCGGKTLKLLTPRGKELLRQYHKV